MSAEQHGFREHSGAREGPDREHLARGSATDAALGRSLALVRFLRERCPWDARQTPLTLRPYLLEEAHETADAVLEMDDGRLVDELGDLLLNVAFQIVLAEERGAFGPEEVVTGLEGKMRSRHPHVYGEAEEPPDWEALKARERATAAHADSDADVRGELDEPEADAGTVTSDPFEGIPSRLEPLSRALRIQDRAAGLNFDWPDVDGAFEKLKEEVDELAEALGGERDSAAAIADELGDVLFAAVNVARLAGQHPSVTLETASAKFARRFRRLLRDARQSGVDPRTATLEQLDSLWDGVKADGGDRDEPGG